MKNLLKILIFPLLILGILFFSRGNTSDVIKIEPRIKSTCYKVGDDWSKWSMWKSVNSDYILYKLDLETFVLKENDKYSYFRLISELNPKEDWIGQRTRTLYCESSKAEPCIIKIIYKEGAKTSELFIELPNRKIKYVYVIN